jgi:hypothetical protein
VTALEFCYETRAGGMLEFAAGLEDAGQVESARRLRAAADDLLRLAEELRAERAARQKIQEERDRCLDLLADRAGQAAKDAAA